MDISIFADVAFNNRQEQIIYVDKGWLVDTNIRELIVCSPTVRYELQVDSISSVADILEN